MATKKKKKKQVEETPMSAALDSMSSIYTAAKNKAATFSGEKVPEGKYELRLSGIKLKEKKLDGGGYNISMQRTFTVLSGENEGMSQTDFIGMSSEGGLAVAMGFVETMGYDIPEGPEDWPEIVEELQEEAPAVMGEVTHSGDFVNIRVTEVLDDEDIDDGEEPEDEDELREELEEMSRKELKAYIAEEELDITVKKKWTEEDIIDAIVEEIFG